MLYLFVKLRCVARRRRINKEIDARIKRESMPIVLHLGDIHDVHGETIVASDFNNSDGGPINVVAYFHDFIFAKGGDCWRYFLS